MRVQRHFTKSFQLEAYENDGDSNYTIFLYDGGDGESVVESLSGKQVEELIKILGLVINRSVKLEEI